MLESLMQGEKVQHFIIAQQKHRQYHITC